MLAMLAAASATSCGTARPKLPTTPALSAAYEATLLSYPVDIGESELCICPPGIPLVTVGGGVAFAGWNGWLLTPSSTPIRSVSCDESGRFAVLRDGSLTTAGNKGGKQHVEMPAGHLHLVGSADAAIWIWGRSGDRSIVLRYDEVNGVQEVLTTEANITALASAGPGAFVFGADGVLWLRQRDASPRPLVRFDGILDGVAVAGDGAAFLSIGSDVLQLSENHKVVPVLRGPHGPLQIVGDTIYVLWRERGMLVRARPKARAALGIASSAAGSLPKPTTGHAAVLVVLNDAVVRGDAVRSLRDRGYIVYDAANADEALRRYTELGRHIDLVISSVVLWDGGREQQNSGGVGLAHELALRQPSLKVLLMSNDEENVVAHHDDDAPVEIDFLERPYEPEELARRVREVLDAPFSGTVPVSPSAAPR